MKTFVGFFNCHQEIKRTKWRWLGHTLRKPADNVTRRGLWWTPQGKRKRGRPKTIWRCSTEAKAKAAGLTWGQLEWKAQDGGGGGGGVGMANTGGRPMFRMERQELSQGLVDVICSPSSSHHLRLLADCVHYYVKFT